jgi:hypothetical protein
MKIEIEFKDETRLVFVVTRLPSLSNPRFIDDFYYEGDVPTGSHNEFLITLPKELRHSPYFKEFDLARCSSGFLSYLAIRENGKIVHIDDPKFVSSDRLIYECLALVFHQTTGLMFDGRPRIPSSLMIKYDSGCSSDILELLKLLDVWQIYTDGKPELKRPNKNSP